MKLARVCIFLLLGWSVGGCYFSQECPADLFDPESHNQRGCIKDIRQQENLENLILLSIVTGGFPGSQIDTVDETDGEGENGGSGVGGD